MRAVLAVVNDAELCRKWASKHKDKGFVLGLCGDGNPELKVRELRRKQLACFVAYLRPRANQIAGIALLDTGKDPRSHRYHVWYQGIHIAREDMIAQELRVLWAWEQLVFTGKSHYKRLRELHWAFMPGDTDPLAWWVADMFARIHGPDHTLMPQEARGSAGGGMSIYL